MSDGVDVDHLRAELVRTLAEEGHLEDPAWRAAMERVPRHAFSPGFYLRSRTDSAGLPVWEPVTGTTDRHRWLRAAYTNQTLITQLDGTEEDWDDPKVHHGGVFTSSSTLPSLVVRMWQDADIRDGHRILEVGTGTGYSTALACERLGSGLVTSVEVDSARLAQAWRGLTDCGYAPRLAETDGTYGYWPCAPYDRIVLACSLRHVPSPLLGQAAPGGKILAPLSGWLHGSARALLTVWGDGTAQGRLLPGTISFMLARRHAPPHTGNPKQWVALAEQTPRRPTSHSPERIAGHDHATFHPAFLAQCTVPDAQRAALPDQELYVDMVSGSVALLEPGEDGWTVRQTGPVRIWDRVEELLDVWDKAGQPAPEAFTIRVDATGQYLTHPSMPDLRIT